MITDVAGVGVGLENQLITYVAGIGLRVGLNLLENNHLIADVAGIGKLLQSYSWQVGDVSAALLSNDGVLQRVLETLKMKNYNLQILFILYSCIYGFIVLT
jgi:hypothetical protein